MHVFVQQFHLIIAHLLACICSFFSIFQKKTTFLKTWEAYSLRSSYFNSLCSSSSKEVVKTSEGWKYENFRWKMSPFLQARPFKDL